MSKNESHQDIKLENTDMSLSAFRLLRPCQIKLMVMSMERVGQLHAVIMRQIDGGYQMLDGFKRYYAAEQLGWSSLSARVLDMSEALGKAMMLSYNNKNGSLIDFEEALILYSLKHDHLMQQKEMSGLLGRSESWISRRLSLIERIEDSVRSQLRMGSLTPAHARELIKLPRGNQPAMAQAIIAHNVTSRQSAWLVAKYLRSGSQAERDYLLRSPMEAILHADKECDVYDSRLCKHGNRLLKTIELLVMQEQIFIGQYNDNRTGSLSDTERAILTPKLKRLSGNSQRIYLLINKKEQ